jgi:ATP-dependent RNA helicase DDX46/PRP5
MQKRRERIERWRAERKKKEQEAIKKDVPKATPGTDEATAKKWSLEDDSEDEDKDNKGEKEEEEEEVAEKEEPDEEKNGEEPLPEVVEDEVDPLDEYMRGVQEEVRKTHKIDMKKPSKADSGNKKGALVIVTGVAKSKINKNKGELIEQNQDGLEYSSEEEQEDLKDTAASIANKQKKELAKIDHTNVRYLPFRKNFYVEVPEIAKMTHEEVEAYKEELEGIRVKGKLFLFLSGRVRVRGFFLDLCYICIFCLGCFERELQERRLQV